MEINFPKLEEKVLRFWKKNRIFENSIKRRKKKIDFVFYEGPPTANAKPGIHHVLSRVFKDIICRYKTMQGFRVLRRAGWDTHGLPVELEIEKKLGLKSKREIEKYGIAKFNEECKKSVWQYKKDWEKLTERIGFWLDMKDPYITYTPEYIESVWWILKTIWQKGLLYQDFKVVPYCPRCQTSLSSHELALGYEKIKEPSIYVKFPILNPEFKNTSLLVWTTTPWTLPGNVAIALNENFVYAKLKIGQEFLILAKERIEATGIQGEIVKEFQGKDLVNLYYQPLYPVESRVGITIYKTLPADFVSLEEGTGLVHIAPAFGEEDLALIKLVNENYRLENRPEFPILLTVDEEGRFRLDIKKWAGLFVKKADPLIIEDLKERNLLFKEELYEHDYPFCWRCRSHLLYYAKKSWFIRMTALKENLIKNNQKINWIPGHLKEGRFGEWLKEIKDWALSRERYWGTPLPIWQCQSCQYLEVIGGKRDLLSQKFSTNQYFFLRHGQTIYQTRKKDLTYPFPEKEPIGLTEEGVEQIKRVIPKLKKLGIDLIYSSDFFRTKQTAEIIAKELKLKVNFDRRLRDINLGIYHGRPKEEYFRDFPISEERFEKKLPKGESWLHCQMRMTEFLKEIDKKYQDKKILIVGHGDPFWLLAGALKGQTKKELVAEKKKKGIIKNGELRRLEFKFLPMNEKGELDFHRPYIDEVRFYCPKCGNLMARVSEVVDCWFDSGAMPFAQAHFPLSCFKTKNLELKIQNYRKLIKKILFPADYISEGIDQTRGWFYTLLAISTLLDFGPSYKNVISLGHVLDEKGEKMSKSKGNVVDPWYIIEKYGVDAVRWYFYTINQPGEAKLFSEKDIEESLRKFIIIFWNCFLFFQTYAKTTSNFRRIIRKSYPLRGENVLDKWIISKLNTLIQDVTESLDNYDITKGARLIEKFVADELSLWYIRRSRERFQKPETKKELEIVSQTLGFVLLTISKLSAPFIPFLSEFIYQKLLSFNFRLPTSIHLVDWSKANKELIDKNLEKKMEKIREMATLVLAERSNAKIKVRQPLSRLKIKDLKLRFDDKLLKLLKEEVNVKEIVFDGRIKKEIELDTKITSELKEEGILREVIRYIQSMRKEAGFRPKDKIMVRYSTEGNLAEILLKNQKLIALQAKIKDFYSEKEKIVFDLEKEIKIEGQTLHLAIKKI